MLAKRQHPSVPEMLERLKRLRAARRIEEATPRALYVRDSGSGRIVELRHHHEEVERVQSGSRKIHYYEASCAGCNELFLQKVSSEAARRTRCTLCSLPDQVSNKLRRIRSMTPAEQDIAYPSGEIVNTTVIEPDRPPMITPEQAAQEAKHKAVLVDYRQQRRAEKLDRLKTDAAG